MCDKQATTLFSVAHQHTA